MRPSGLGAVCTAGSEEKGTGIKNSPAGPKRDTCSPRAQFPPPERKSRTKGKNSTNEVNGVKLRLFLRSLMHTLGYGLKLLSDPDSATPLDSAEAVPGTELS
ncbi:hypothetical protein JEQ12_001966 [Ovis aries]|uniref:Uncharacterized protein n=1 Tax=Ovis aries TaxID=9940 RepID=A0A836AQQ0_SHEEP|nr:hypothetical protein JEQ12_001966 [Ovis aries]